MRIKNESPAFCKFLEKFAQATKLMSASTYPTLGMVVPVLRIVQTHVKRAISANEGFRATHTQNFARAVQTKLDEYEDGAVH